MAQSNVPNAIALLDDASWKLRQALKYIALTGHADLIECIAGANKQIQAVLDSNAFKEPLSGD